VFLELFPVAICTYSGSDIAVVVHEALMLPIRLVQAATHFKRVIAPDRKDPSRTREFWMPCSPGDPAAQPMTWQDIQGDDLIEPPVSMVRGPQ
jgi:vacuolar protein-sorting-associated protein 4